MRILITGAAGRIGRSLRAKLAGRYPLIRLLDRLPIDDCGPGEEAVAGDIADLGLVERAMEGIDGVIHMAGVPYEGTFDEMLPTNIVGMWNIYEAARRKGAKRVVFGSSNHAVGFYPRGRRIDASAPVRPDTRYGLTKCWGEAIGHLYADKYGVTSLHIRIGSFTPRPENERSLALWVSGRDLAQLCRIGLEHQDIHSDIVFGISENARAWYDNATAYRLGYKPQDRAEDHAETAMQGEAKLTRTAVDAYFQGGPFCAMEYEGGPIPPDA
jgi:uronate dehydrogenase